MADPLEENLSRQPSNLGFTLDIQIPASDCLSTIQKIPDNV